MTKSILNVSPERPLAFPKRILTIVGTNYKVSEVLQLDSIQISLCQNERLVVITPIAGGKLTPSGRGQKKQSVSL